MHFNSATLVAALLASRGAALVLPRDDDVTIGGSDAPGDEIADLVAAYEQVADVIPESVAAPIGTGSESIPDDISAITEAATDDATSGTLSRRDIFARGTCKAQPTKLVNGTDVSSLNRAAWEALAGWKSSALAASTPNGFFQVPNWRGLLASAEAQPYKGFTSDLTFYDTEKCASRCKSISGCMSFVIYYERNPKINLDTRNCPSADAQTIVKCAFYGTPLTSSQATNIGGYTGGPDPKEPIVNGRQNAFYTSIAGSNAYTTVPQTPAGFYAPVDLGEGTILAPKGANTYMGIQTFPDVSFNPQLCADSCNAKSAYNQRQAQRKGLSDYRKCRFFDAYVAYRNDSDPLFTCTYYTASYGAQYATNIEQWNSAGDHFNHGSSYGYTLIENLVAEA